MLFPFVWHTCTVTLVDAGVKHGQMKLCSVCKSNLCDLNTPFCSVIQEREGIPLLWTMSGPPTYILFKPSVFKEAVNEQKVCLKCFKQWMICLR